MTKSTQWPLLPARLRSAWASADQSLRCPIRDFAVWSESSLSDQSLLCPHEETLGPQLPIECTTKTQISLSITDHFVGFVMRRFTWAGSFVIISSCMGIQMYQKSQNRWQQLVSDWVFLIVLSYMYLHNDRVPNPKKMSFCMTKNRSLCAQRRLRSEWASTQSDQSSSDQNGHRHVWSESSLSAQWVANPSFLHADREDSDQTRWMPRLIWVFTGCTCHFVGFVKRQLKCSVPFLGCQTVLEQAVQLNNKKKMKCDWRNQNSFFFNLKSCVFTTGKE